MKTYNFGIEWIALNDDPSETSWEEIQSYMSVALVADFFGVSTEKVAVDVMNYRIKHEVGK